MLVALRTMRVILGGLVRARGDRTQLVMFNIPFLGGTTGHLGPDGLGLVKNIRVTGVASKPWVCRVDRHA